MKQSSQAPRFLPRNLAFFEHPVIVLTVLVVLCVLSFFAGGYVSEWGA